MADEPTVADMAEAYSLDAVDHAKAAADLTLDFSAESVELVEQVLGVLHESLPRGFFAKLFGSGPSSSQLETMSKMYGCYLGEVLRRTAGGTWEFTENGVALVKGDAQVWPTAKAYKRIINGDEDNVAVYFKVLLNEHWPQDEAD